ncbi:MAG: hypothetical protein HOP30_20710 [Cyclobacteriaceae bacterium]|nr:hypothetical protein [Cyclobacteriaceae bacterium]
MDRVNSKEQLRIVFSILEPIMIKYGFIRCVVENLDTYSRKEPFGFSRIQFRFTQDGYLSFSKAVLSFFDVEKLIIDVKSPFNDYVPYIQKGYLPSTIHDSQGLLNYDVSLNPIRFRDKAEAFGHAYAEYLQTAGLAFIEKYSYLPNVLAEMDRLEKEGKLWHEILNGLADYLFRGLIISKLCNDTAFLSKLEFCDHKFYNAPHLVEWIPYYEKLKERLKELEPRYTTNG